MADIPIGIDNQFRDLPSYFQGYLTETDPTFIVSVTEEEIIVEIPQFREPNVYGEYLAVLRKISRGLLEYDAFLFHAAAIAVDGCGVVFTAKSGVGNPPVYNYGRIHSETGHGLLMVISQFSDLRIIS